jgi:hypothetical protein
MNQTLSGMGIPDHEARQMQMLFAGAMAASATEFGHRVLREGWTIEQAVDPNGDYEPYCTITLATGIQLRIRVDVMGHEISED